MVAASASPHAHTAHWSCVASVNGEAGLVDVIRKPPSHLPQPAEQPDPSHQAVTFPNLP